MNALKRRRALSVAFVSAVALALPAATWGAPLRLVDDETPSVTLDVTTLTPGVLQPLSSLVVGVTLSNPDPHRVDGLSVVVSMTDGPISDRALLNAWEAGDLDLPSRVCAQTTASVDGAVTGPGQAAVTLSVPPDTLDLPADANAVYGVTATVQDSTGVLDTVHTFATWMGTEPRVVPVALLVLASGSVERVDALLDTVDIEEASFAVDPTVLSSDAVGTLAGLDTYLLPAGNLDTASLARAGGSMLLDLALDRARSVSSALSEAPWLAVVANPDQASFNLAADRGASAVLALPSFSGVLPVTTGYDGGVPPGVATPTLEPPEEASGGAPVLLLPDTGLSAAFAGTTSGSATAPARLRAETALLAEANTAANPVLVVVGPSWLIEADHDSATLAALVTSPWVSLVPLETLLAHQPIPTVALEPSLPSETDIPVSLVSAAGTSLRGIVALAEATPDPLVFSEPFVDALLGALSLDRRTGPAARDEALTSTIEEIDGIRASVFLPESSPLNLISKSGNLPVTVENDLEVSVTVRIVVESRSPILRVGELPELVLAPGTSQQVLVPVSAVSSGNVDVRVSLESLGGARLTPVSEFSLRIHAQWGEVFTVVLASLAFLLFVAGIVRTVRRGKAGTRGGPSDLPRAKVKR